MEHSENCSTATKHACQLGTNEQDNTLQAFRWRLNLFLLPFGDTTAIVESMLEWYFPARKKHHAVSNKTMNKKAAPITSMQISHDNINLKSKFRWGSKSTTDYAFSDK